MKTFLETSCRQFVSLFTDHDWDADATKVFGIGLIVCGVIGFFQELPDFAYLLTFGAGLVATGKFSKEG